MELSTQTGFSGAALSDSPPSFDQRKAIQIELAPVPHGKSGNDNGR